MAATRIALYARFPEWDLTDYPNSTPNAAQNILVEAMIAGAEAQTDRSVFATEALADEAILYLACHLLARALPAVNARLQKARGDDNLHTGEDVYWPVYARLARAATSGYRNT